MENTPVLQTVRWWYMVSTSRLQISKDRISYSSFFFWKRHHYRKDSSIHKDRIECFDNDYFPCRKKNKCKLMHVQQWFDLFSDYYNKEIVSQLYRAIKSNLLFKQVTFFIIKLNAVLDLRLSWSIENVLTYIYTNWFH